MAPQQLLQLADTMAKRHAAQGYTGEALLLHVEVLRQQGRLGEAAQLVADAGGRAFPMAGDRRSLHASLLVSSQSFGCPAAAGKPPFAAQVNRYRTSFTDNLSCAGGGWEAGGGGGTAPGGVAGEPRRLGLPAGVPGLQAGGLRGRGVAAARGRRRPAAVVLRCHVEH